MSRNIIQFSDILPISLPTEHNTTDKLNALDAENQWRRQDLVRGGKPLNCFNLL